MIGAAGTGLAGAARPGDVDVSRAPDAQAEVSIAADPSNPEVLAAGSMSLPSGGDGFPSLRAYTSTDGGATWSSAFGPVPPEDASCSGSAPAADPVLAVDTRGREYFAFVATNCARTQGFAYVARRAGPAAAWETPAGPAVASLGVRTPRRDDKPALAVDDSQSSPFRDRVFLVFQEIDSGDDELVLTYSADGGASWSPPLQFAAGFIASLAVAADGTLFIAWSDGTHLFMARSGDGGKTLSNPRAVVRIRNASLSPAADLDHEVSSSPSLAVFGHRVYLSFDDVRRGNRVGVFLKVLDPNLRPYPGFAQAREVAATARPADRFLPVVATDATTGRVWDCFYATDGAPSRAAVRFSCSSSADGGSRWSHATPVASAFSRDPLPLSFGYGDYEGLAVAGGTAHPIWTDGRAGFGPLGTEIYTATLR